MIPIWKLKRETKRLWRQLLALPPFLISFFLSTPWYDLVLSRQKKIFLGEIPKYGKTAIYLIFPKDGLLGSHFIALNYMIKSGYAPVVVSNTGLDPDDRQRLLKHCRLYIERPNYGYDFGGYRDAILHLSSELPSTHRLAILNDSSWFPTDTGRNWLEETETMGVDFAGAASNYGIKREELNNLERMEWTYSTNHKNFHYCSYALSISANIMKDPKFLRYWQTLRISQNKKRTVRRGEIGLTRWVISNGYSHGDICNLEKLDDALGALSPDRLETVLERVIVPEDPRLRGLKHNILDIVAKKDDGWRQTAEKFVMLAVARQGVSYALTEFTTREMRFPFIKKSPLWLDEEAAEITLEMLKNMSGDNSAVFLREALQLNRTRKLSLNDA